MQWEVARNTNWFFWMHVEMGTCPSRDAPCSRASVSPSAPPLPISPERTRNSHRPLYDTNSPILKGSFDGMRYYRKTMRRVFNYWKEELNRWNIKNPGSPISVEQLEIALAELTEEKLTHPDDFPSLFVSVVRYIKTNPVQEPEVTWRAYKLHGCKHLVHEQEKPWWSTCTFYRKKPKD